MAKGARQGSRGTDAEIGRLYSLPLGEFTAARNALVARLKKEGHGAEAARVKALVKPGPSAWAVNALLRAEPAAMKELLAAGERARTAQRRVAAGRAGAADLRQALEEARRQRDELRRRGAALLAESGRKPSQAVLERLTGNLDALALDPAATAVQKRGWLDADLEPPGFEVLAGLQLAAGAQYQLRLLRGGGEADGGEAARARPARGHAGPRAVRAIPTVTRRSAASAEPAHPAPSDEARRRWEEAARARSEREAAKRRERLARIEERLSRARDEATERRAEAEQKERAAAEAERAAATARREAERARERSDRAAEQVAKVREELDAARGEG
jgi:hypothetical protein